MLTFDDVVAHVYGAFNLSFGVGAASTFSFLVGIC